MGTVHIRTRHSGREAETVCGALYALDVVDNDQPTCWPCWIRTAFREGMPFSTITMTLFTAFGETQEVQGAYAMRVLEYGHPSRWP